MNSCKTQLLDWQHFFPVVYVRNMKTGRSPWWPYPPPITALPLTVPVMSYNTLQLLGRGRNDHDNNEL